jgi:hypothetical protein
MGQANEDMVIPQKNDMSTIAFVIMLIKSFPGLVGRYCYRQVF